MLNHTLKTSTFAEGHPLAVSALSYSGFKRSFAGLPELLLSICQSLLLENHFFMEFPLSNLCFLFFPLGLCKDFTELFL